MGEFSFSAIIVLMKPVRSLPVLCSSIMALICVSCAGQDADRQSWHDFYYSMGTKNDYQGKMYYTDSFFDLPASTYQPSLATSSLSLAMAGFASNREASKSFSNRYQNAIALMEDLGFVDVSPNDDYLKQPGMDTFGTVMGHKPLGKKTLVAVTVRGGNYLSEWASNFTLGDEEKNPYAHGFYDASEIYLSSLRKYLQSTGISGEIVLWTAGYSRGGASVNLSVGRLDEELRDGKHDLLPGVTYTKDDLYAYCFEAPAGAYFTEEDRTRYAFQSEDFNNIHCIINLNDPVPLVAPKDYSFCRYGKEYYLSDPLTDFHHDAFKSRMIGFFDRMNNSKELGPYQIDKFEKKSLFGTAGVLGADLSKHRWTQGRQLNEFVYRLGSAIGSREKFVQSLQPSLRDIFHTLYHNGMPKESLINVGLGIAREIILLDGENILMTDIMHQPKRFFADLKPYLKNALADDDLDIDVNEFIDLLQGIFNALSNMVLTSGGLDALASFFSKENIKGFAQAHRPELCLAHLQAMDAKFGEDHSTKLAHCFYVLRGPGVQSLTIQRAGRNVIVVKDGAVEQVSNSLCYGFEGADFVAYLPINQEYVIASCDPDSMLSLYCQPSNSASELLVNRFEAAELSSPVTFQTPDRSA